MLNDILWPDHIQWQTPTDQTLYRTRPFTEFWVVPIEHLRRVWHADRGRLLLLTPGLFGTCIRSTSRDQSFSELVVILPDYALRISLGTFSILRYENMLLRYMDTLLRYGECEETPSSFHWLRDTQTDFPSFTIPLPSQDVIGVLKYMLLFLFAWKGDLANFFHNDERMLFSLWILILCLVLLTLNNLKLLNFFFELRILIFKPKT